jgi:hypothetical protein
LKKNLILTFSSKGDDFAGRDLGILRFKKVLQFQISFTILWFPIPKNTTNKKRRYF